MNEVQRTNILLVEDEQADIDFAKYAFDGGELDHTISVAPSGKCALVFLEGVVGTEDFPHLVLLDMNLPDMTGIDLLTHLRKEEKFSQVPIILLSTSNYDKDVRAAYSCFANAYVQKPLRLKGFEELVESIERFWFGQATLPPTTPPQARP